MRNSRKNVPFSIKNAFYVIFRNYNNKNLVTIVLFCVLMVFSFLVLVLFDKLFLHPNNSITIIPFENITEW